MKKILFTFIAFLMLLHTNAQTSIFNDLLQKHVSDEGIVDYQSFKKDEAKLDSYIKYLEKMTPESSWSKDKERAFWINAYNAYTIKLILENYPLKSIMDIERKDKNAWKIPFAKIGNTTYSLDHIEHQILRKKLFDPKIHVGVNCASMSCPKLGNVAFTKENIDAELTKLMKAFVNDPNRNKITEKRIQISEIFNWFKGDFTKNGSIIDYLNKYSENEIKSNAKISYLKYDWSLNGK